MTQPQRSASVGVDVTAAEHHLEGPGAADRAARGAPCRDPPRQDAEGDLRLAERPPCRSLRTAGRTKASARCRRRPTRPSITAIVGFGIVRKHSHMRWNAFSSVGGGRSVGICRISPTSKWAMKKSGFALRRTTTRSLLVGGQLLGDRRHLEVERQIEQVDRWVVDRDRGDAPVDATRNAVYPSYAMPFGR